MELLLFDVYSRLADYLLDLFWLHIHYIAAGNDGLPLGTFLLDIASVEIRYVLIAHPVFFRWTPSD